MSIFNEIKQDFKNYGTIKSTQAKSLKAGWKCYKDSKVVGKDVAREEFRTKLQDLHTKTRHITSDQDAMEGVKNVGHAIWVGVTCGAIACIFDL